MSNENNYKPEKVSATNTRLLILLAALVLAVGYLQFDISQRRAFMQSALGELQAQYVRTQRIGMLLTQFLNTADSAAMTDLKQVASEAFASEDITTAWLLSTMPASLLDQSGETKIKSFGTHAVHMLIQHSFTFISSPDQSREADEVLKLARGDVPQYFAAEIGYFAIAKNKEITQLTYVCYGLLGIMMLVALYQSAAIVNPAMKYITRLMEHIDHMAATDNLTGFYNRIMLFKIAATLISGAKRHKHDLAVLAADIDNFKVVNDTYGRVAGDAAIRAVANKFKEVLRTSDVVGRVAGQEFGIFLPSTDEYRAALVAEKLRAAVQDMPYAVKDKTVFLTVSIGVAALQGHHKNADDMLRAAETALASAKQTGRNKVVTQSSLNAPGATQDSAAAAATAV